MVVSDDVHANISSVCADCPYQEMLNVVRELRIEKNGKSIKLSGLPQLMTYLRVDVTLKGLQNRVGEVCSW